MGEDNAMRSIKKWLRAEEAEGNNKGNKERPSITIKDAINKKKEEH